MIGNSTLEYIFIHVCILSLRLITPLSFLHIICSWYTGSWCFFTWLGFYTSAEALFYLGVYLPRTRHLQGPAVHLERRSREERQALFAKCFSTARHTDLATGWFDFSHSNTIRRGNFIEWILWAMFSPPEEQMLEDWEKEIEDYVQMIEKLIGHKLEDGRGERVRCIKITMDPIFTLHRPLFWYLLVAIVDSAASLYLTISGFAHFRSNKWCDHFPPRLWSLVLPPSSHPRMSYWYRPHRSDTQYPIVFLHGIGIGLGQYIPFLRDIAKAHPDVGIIAFENLTISKPISPPPLSRAATLTAIRTVLDEHGFSEFVVCAHSYGTVVAAHTLHDPELSERVTGWLFVAPIPFLLHLPAVAYNFIHRHPRTASEWLLWYFASRDPDIACALGRHFFWSEYILWRDDLQGKRVGVVLGSRDQIVHSAEVRRYLTGENEPAECWVSDASWKALYRSCGTLFDHSQVFDHATLRAPMLNVLHVYKAGTRYIPLVPRYSI